MLGKGTKEHTSLPLTSYMTPPWLLVEPSATPPPASPDPAGIAPEKTKETHTHTHACTHTRVHTHTHTHTHTHKMFKLKINISRSVKNLLVGEISLHL